MAVVVEPVPLTAGGLIFGGAGRPESVVPPIVPFDPFPVPPIPPVPRPPWPRPLPPPRPPVFRPPSPPPPVRLPPSTCPPAPVVTLPCWAAAGPPATPRAAAAATHASRFR